jgi:hypothetical protein
LPRQGLATSTLKEVQRRGRAGAARRRRDSFLLLPCLNPLNVFLPLAEALIHAPLLLFQS